MTVELDKLKICIEDKTWQKIFQKMLQQIFMQSAKPSFLVQTAFQLQ
jgi:hypothetical protein